MKRNFLPEIGTINEWIVEDLLKRIDTAESFGNPNPEKASGRQVEVFGVPEDHLIYDEVWDKCQEYSDATGIQFDAIQDLAIMKYGLHDGYKPHIDYILNETKEPRKISFVAQLNDDYAGGELVFTIGNKSMKVPKKAGVFTVFPSFIEHEVREVVSGTRISCVAWTIGKQWR